MRPGRGYTLIELVVALAVLALSSLLIVQSVRLGLRAWESVSARVSRAEAVAVAQQALRGRLSQVYPYKPQSGTAPYAFQGQATEARFSAPGPHSQSGEMLRYRVYFEPGNGTGALKVAWQADPGPDGQSTVTESATETLLEGVAEAGFEYFYVGDQKQGVWMSSWLDKPEPPVLVRLNLRFAKGSAEDWPALVVRPRITMPADCRFDAVSRRCS